MQWQAHQGPITVVTPEIKIFRPLRSTSAENFYKTLWSPGLSLWSSLAPPVSCLSEVLWQCCGWYIMFYYVISCFIFCVNLGYEAWLAWRGDNTGVQLVIIVLSPLSWLSHLQQYHSHSHCCSPANISTFQSDNTLNTYKIQTRCLKATWEPCQKNQSITASWLS